MNQANRSRRGGRRPAINRKKVPKRNIRSSVGTLSAPPIIHGANQVGIPPRVRPSIFTIQLKGYFDLTASSSTVSQRISTYSLLPLASPAFSSGGEYQDAPDLITCFDYFRPRTITLRYEPQQAITTALTPVLIAMSSTHLYSSSRTDDDIFEIPNCNVFDPRYPATFTYKIPRITNVTNQNVLRGGWIPTTILDGSQGSPNGTIYVQKTAVGITSGTLGRVYIWYDGDFRYQE